MKYVIELEKLEGTDLYRAKGAKTLVFDERGIGNILIPLDEYLKKEEPKKEFKIGDTVRTENGTTKYTFCGYSDNGLMNCVNLNNNQFVTLNADKVVLAEDRLDNNPFSTLKANNGVLVKDRKAEIWF